MRILNLLLAFSAAAGLSACSQSATPEESASADITTRPNIIIVLTDDLGYGDIGANAETPINTPNLDRMAREGVRMTSFYAAANVCTPSRAGLLTGRYPIRMGLAADVIRPQSTHGLPPSETTLAELLAGNGYTTAMIGKWHLGHTPEFWPTGHGFETFFGVPYSNDMQPFALYDGTSIVEDPADQAALTRRYTERAIEIIEESGDKPFFLYLAHTFPHIPLYSEDPFEGRSAAGAYGDTVETIDWSMGELLEALRRTGQAENTLVLFTSDNGPWFEGSSGASRDRKGGAWEGAFRVPFIAWWPGALDGGRVVNGAATGLDILPTLSELTGSATDDLPALDGRSIWPMLREGAASPHDHVLFFNEDQIAAVRRDEWRLVVRDYYKTYDVPLQAFGYPLLFNLETDPGESYSLADREPEIVEELLSVIEQQTDALGVTPRTTLSTGQDDGS